MNNRRFVTALAAFLLVACGDDADWEGSTTGDSGITQDSNFTTTGDVTSSTSTTSDDSGSDATSSTSTTTGDSGTTGDGGSTTTGDVTSSTSTTSDDSGSTTGMLPQQPMDGSLYSWCDPQNPVCYTDGGFSDEDQCMCVDVCAKDTDCPSLEGSTNIPICAMGQFCALSCDEEHPCPEGMLCLVDYPICMTKPPQPFVQPGSRFVLRVWNGLVWATSQITLGS